MCLCKKIYIEEEKISAWGSNSDFSNLFILHLKSIRLERWNVFGKITVLHPHVVNWERGKKNSLFFCEIARNPCGFFLFEKGELEIGEIALFCSG